MSGHQTEADGMTTDYVTEYGRKRGAIAVFLGLAPEHSSVTYECSGAELPLHTVQGLVGAAIDNAPRGYQLLRLCERGASGRRTLYARVASDTAWSGSQSSAVGERQ